MSVGWSVCPLSFKATTLSWMKGIQNKLAQMFNTLTQYVAHSSSCAPQSLLSHSEVHVFHFLSVTLTCKDFEIIWHKSRPHERDLTCVNYRSLP